MAEIRIPPVLRAEAGGNRSLTVEAATVREALTELVERYPSLQSRVLDADGVPTFLNVFVDGEDVRLGDGLQTEVGESSKILLLPAVAGGAFAARRWYGLDMGLVTGNSMFLKVIACAQRA
jgi:molybdopterin synthase sulfur carrier subunit